MPKPWRPMAPAKIMWGITAYGPFPYAPVYTSHLRAMAFATRYFEVDLADGTVFAGIGSTDRTYTHAAENRLADELLQSDATHLFMTEMDMILPKHAIPSLLELDKPVVSGVYFLRGGNGQPCLYKKVLTPPDNPYVHSPVHVFPRSGPFRIDCPGLGCVLIHRSVFERVERPWFDLSAAKYGSGMYFYTKVKQAGIEVWAHPGVYCDQIDYTVVGYRDYVKRLQTDPEFAKTGFLIGMDEAALRDNGHG